MTSQSERISDTEILEIFDAAAEGTLSTPEVKERIDYSRSGTWGRLLDLEADGYLIQWKTGDGMAATWSITETGHQVLEGTD